MKKKRILCVLVTFGTVYILLQLDIGSYMSKQRNKNNISTASTNQHTDGKSSEISRDQHKNVQSFVSVCSAHMVQAFLFDPGVLETVISNRSQSATAGKADACKFFCSHRKVISFAVLASDWRKEVLTSLEGHGFSVLTFAETDPRLGDRAWQDSSNVFRQPGKASIPTVVTHYLMHREKYYIHLAILYERGQDFLWQGLLTWDQLSTGDGDTVTVKLEDILHAQYAATYSWLEVVQVQMDGLQIFAPRFPTLLLRQFPTSQFIECNHSRSALFYLQHGRDDSSDGAIFRKRARLLLLRAQEILSELGIQWWISSGTLLGWFRQCDIITYSMDVDIGIWIKDYDSRLIPAMKSAGLPLKHQFGRPDDSFELSFQAGAVKLDVFFFYDDGEIMWNGGTQVKSGKKYKYTFPKFDICWAHFLSIKIRVPCTTQTYIEANYGTNWMEPVKHWDWKTSPSNVRENGVWPEDEWSEVIQTF